MYNGAFFYESAVERGNAVHYNARREPVPSLWCVSTSHHLLGNSEYMLRPQRMRPRMSLTIKRMDETRCPDERPRNRSQHSRPYPRACSPCSLRLELTSMTCELVDHLGLEQIRLSLCLSALHTACVPVVLQAPASPASNSGTRASRTDLDLDSGLGGSGPTSSSPLSRSPPPERPRGDVRSPRHSIGDGDTSKNVGRNTSRTGLGAHTASGGGCFTFKFTRSRRFRSERFSLACCSCCVPQCAWARALVTCAGGLGECRTDTGTGIVNARARKG